MSESKKQGVKLRNEDKLARIPIKVVPLAEVLKKPSWIKVKLPTGENFNRVKNLLREHKLHTVCEEASCPNIGECFDKGTATFMIMGDICTRRCPFCDVGHGLPNPLDTTEPAQVANSVDILKLRYVVITSVDRDDLRDGGAGHFVECIQEIRKVRPQTKIEILVWPSAPPTDSFSFEDVENNSNLISESEILFSFKVSETKLIISSGPHK